MDPAAIFGGVTGHLSVAQACARMALIFLYGLALVRFAGRRVFGKWAALDIVVSVMIGSNLSRAATGNAALLPTMAESALLLLLHWGSAQAAARFSWIAWLVEGRQIVLGRDGTIDDAKRRRHGVSEGDLREALRRDGLREIGQTQEVALEPSGRLGVIRAE